MSVIFTSTIKMKDEHNWYIELKDMVDQRVAVCKDLEEFSQKVEDFGSDYGGHVDSVNWYKDSDVPDIVMDEIRLLMSQYKEETGIEVS